MITNTASITSNREQRPVQTQKETIRKLKDKLFLLTENYKGLQNLKGEIGNLKSLVTYDAHDYTLP